MVQLALRVRGLFNEENMVLQLLVRVDRHLAMLKCAVQLAKITGKPMVEAKF
jgi:hypothetical protein